MLRTLREVQALADQHGLDVLDIQRTPEGWSVALASVAKGDDEQAVAGLAADRAYGEGLRLSDAIAKAAGKIADA